MATPPGVGGSFGKSSPYFDLARGAVDDGRNGSVIVRDGVQLSGRVDAPIAGPWRARVEGSTASWPAERQIYDSGFQLVATDTVGRVKARQIVAMVGRQGGRSPVCGYVLAGGGIYSLGFRGATLRRPGVALAVGLAVPTGDHGSVHADVNLHLIDTRARYPIASSTALAASLSVGWAYRF